MRLSKVTNALVIDLDKLSGVRLENLEHPDRFRVYLLVDGREYFAASFPDREKRKRFVDKLIEVWGNDESGTNDSSTAVD